MKHQTNAASVFRDKLYLERAPLNSRLNEALKSPLITVVAGEGYGKTHSVYSFLQRANVHTTWLQLSERDNLGWRFWENYTTAIGLYQRELGGRLLNLGFPNTIRQFDRYVTQIEQGRIKDQHYVMVLDDLHLIHETPVLHFLERHMSVPFINSTLILISRKEPDNFVSLLSKGRLSQITVEDLRFSKQETGEYFALQYISLSPGELDQIYHDSEGWALAISLVVQEMKRQGGEQQEYARIHGPLGRESLLRDTAFSNLSWSADLRKFLIKLSLIEHWPRELLEKLAVNTVMEEMESFSSFIRYDTFLHSYQIHHLFLEFLKEKQHELSALEIREVYLAAASWCLENNLRTDAAIDCERAHDYQGLISIINSFPRILPNAIAAFFLGIVDRLPAAEDEDLAFLRYAIRPRLILGLGRLDEAVEENRQSIAKFEALESSPLGSRILAACYNCLGALAIIACRDTREYHVAPLFEQSNRYFLRHPKILEGPITQTCIGSYIIQTGYPAEVGELERALREFSPAVGPASNSFNGYLYGSDTLGWAELNFFAADLGNAEKFARQAVFQGREKNQYEIENRALFYLLRINLYAGNFSVIGETLKQLEAQLENAGFLNRYILYDIESGWLYAQIGQTGKIASWLKNDFEASEPNVMFHGFETLVKAKCSFAEKRYEAVLKTLSQGSLGGFILGRLEMTVLRAVTLHALGKNSEALEALEDAWAMAAPNSLNMPFIELGEDMRSLAALALEKKSSIPRLALESIRSKALVYAKKLSAVAERVGQESGDQRPLSFREIAVLNGLSQGLTRQEIAGDNSLSLGTVKKVITGLYAKLGALNRADAVRIAGAAGLIDPEPFGDLEAFD
jgi:LuxR family maltose regulon positive regulatory protein